MSVIADMNRLRPLPTLERERRAFVANAAFAVTVLVGLWLFELPVLVPGVVVAVLLALLAGRLAHRARRGDEPAPEVRG